MQPFQPALKVHEVAVQQQRYCDNCQDVTAHTVVQRLDRNRAFVRANCGYCGFDGDAAASPRVRVERY